MADESEVEDALCDFIVSVLYPGGTDGLGASAPSTAGAPAKVQRGMPLSLDLEAMIAAGVIDIAVAARNGVERNTTRYDRDWFELQPPVRTITATVVGSTVTLGGTVSVPQNVAVRVGRAGLFIYQVQAGDTLSMIASGLAAGLAGIGIAATATGPSLTVSATDPVDARVGGYGIAAQELKRQDKSFQITLFAPSPELRDALSRLLDPALAELNFLPLPDGTQGLVRYERTIVIDSSEKMSEYRRDLFYWVEFPTITTRPAPEVISFGINATGGHVPSAAPTLSTRF